MPVVSLVLFLIGAIFGIIVWTAVFRNRPTPKSSVYIHGLLVVAAFLILLIYVGRVAGNAPALAIVLFAMAAILGLILYSRDTAKKTLPKWLAVIHPLIAIAGLIALIIYVKRAW
jgi:hypothetical protein